MCMMYVSLYLHAPTPQIESLSQHYSQYDNATELAESVKQLGLATGEEVGISGFAEGFIRVVELS